MILGLAHTLEDAPKEYDGEIWTCNDGAIRRTVKYEAPYITAMFDVHNLNVAEASEKQAALLCESFNIPVYSVQEYPWLRNSHRLPKEAIEALIQLDVFSNVVSYMLGYAILQGFEEIDLWAVHHHPAQRDAQETAIVHLWLGIALGRGIKISVKDYNDAGCAIMKNGEYWTGPGAYGHWDNEKNRLMEQEARENPLKSPGTVTTKEVKL